MKRRLAAVLVVLLCSVSLLFSAVTETNRQKVHATDSDVYRAIKWLYIENSLALPSTTWPWTESELDLMMSRIDRNDLSGSAAKTYDWIQSELNETPRVAQGIFGLNVSLYTEPDFRVHSIPEDFSDPDMWGGKGDWYIPAKFLSVPIEGWMGNNAYAYFDLDLLQTPRRLRFSDGHSEKDNYFTSSIPALTPHTAKNWDLSWDFPYRAFGSIGGSWWNVSIERDNLSWGNGETGNFAIGDQLPFHENLRASAFSKNFKYTFSVSSFFHPMNYYNEKGDQIDLGYDQSHKKEGIRLFIAHRLEWHAVKWLNFAVTESYMYSSRDTAPDGILLSPTSFFHNFYIRSNSNSLLSFDLDVTPLKGWNIYFQLAIDEINGNAELSRKEEPMAFTYIAGSKWRKPYKGGSFYGSVEGVYTDTYLYLRYSGIGKAGAEFGINFVVPIINNASGDCTWEYLGYRYGGDAIVGAVDFGYKRFGKWKAETGVTYIAHGTVDQFTRWDRFFRKDTPKGTTSTHPENGSYLENSNWKERNAVSHTVILDLEGRWSILKNLEIWSILDYICVVNQSNIKGRLADDLQFSCGIRYTL